VTNCGKSFQSSLTLFDCIKSGRHQLGSSEPNAWGRSLILRRLKNKVYLLTHIKKTGTSVCFAEGCQFLSYCFYMTYV
jgi:hypothetical protein